MRLKRKVDNFLLSWKNDKTHLPLIIKGARQIGKTDAIEHFAKNNYKSVVEINFVLQKQYKSIFDDGFEVDTIIKILTLNLFQGKLCYFLMKYKIVSIVPPP